MLALEAAALLPDGDPDKHSTFASAGALLAGAGRHAMAADACAGAAAAAPDEVARARHLTAEGEAARFAGSWWRAVDAHERALALAEAIDASSLDTATIAQNLAMTCKYFLGLSLLRRRRSSYIGGAAGDTEELATHLHRHLDLTTGIRRPRLVRAPVPPTPR